MIWIWLRKLLSYALRLFIVPPDAPQDRIDPNGKCPACGNRTGALKFERVGPMQLPRVKHTCAVCGCAWYEKTMSVPDEPAV